MATVTITDVPEDVLAELSARAARCGRTLEEYLVAVLCDIAGGAGRTAWIRAVEDRLALFPTSMGPSTIVGYLDEIRR